MQPSSQQKIIGRFNRRDNEAGGRIYEEFLPFVSTLVRNLIHPSPDTMDLVHDIFIKLFENNSRFASRANIRLFLHNIGRNICLNYLNTRKRRTDKTNEIADHFLSIDEDTLEKATIAASFHSLICQAIKKLPEKKREIFLLYYRDYLSNKEVAERLGIAEKTAANEKSDVLKRLKMEVDKMTKSEMQVLFILLLTILYETC
jgi:RNA polymerase sigma factor (sigma-70 family)